MRAKHRSLKAIIDLKAPIPETRIVTARTSGMRFSDLPKIASTLGPYGLDIRTLNSQEACFTYDPGLSQTATCTSAITYIDGDQGILLYRGYPVEELAAQGTFPEVIYLLLHKELPSGDQATRFNQALARHTMVHEQVHAFYKGFRRDAHPMAIMVGVVGGLSAFYHDSLNIHSAEQRDLASLRLIAKMPTLAAMAYKYSVGEPFMYPQNNLSYTGNFLHMMFARPSEPYVPNPLFERALDVIFTLHADHEQNASTSTVRLAGSSGANPFACVSAGIASLWGPAHGGANEAALRMLRAIGTPDRIPEFLERAKNPEDPFRLMGFGHRVYKSKDPRARIMQSLCRDVLAACGMPEDPLFKLAEQLEAIAQEDPYFVERKLYPNVDFYSGLMLYAMGIPLNMFTVLFAVSRVVGWVAHWNEMIEDPHMKIGRPRQIYVGPPLRHHPLTPPQR